MENKVLAVVTPDTILQDDYIQAVRSEGLGDYLQPEEKADPAEAPAFDIGMGYLETVLPSGTEPLRKTATTKRLPISAARAKSITMWTVCPKM